MPSPAVGRTRQVRPAYDAARVWPQIQSGEVTRARIYYGQIRRAGLTSIDACMTNSVASAENAPALRCRGEPARSMKLTKISWILVLLLMTVPHVALGLSSFPDRLSVLRKE